MREELDPLLTPTPRAPHRGPPPPHGHKGGGASLQPQCLWRLVGYVRVCMWCSVCVCGVCGLSVCAVHVVCEACVCGVHMCVVCMWCVCDVSVCCVYIV